MSRIAHSAHLHLVPMTPIEDLSTWGAVPVERLQRAFVLDMERRALAPGTIRRRRDILRAVIRECGDPLHVDAEQIQKLLDAKTLSPRTRYAWISHLHAFYAWAQQQGHTTIDPTTRIVRPKLDQLLPRPISDPDLATALELAGREMHAWLVLMAYAGLRCAEVATLERHGVMDAHGMLRVMGKGRKERMVPMHPLVADTLASYPMTRTGAVFRRQNGTPWPPQQLSRRVAVFFDELVIDATAHQLRHWFGTMIQRECGDIRVTQELLGHSSPNTTAGYAAFSSERGAAAVSGLPVALRRAA